MKKRQVKTALVVSLVLAAVAALVVVQAVGAGGKGTEAKKAKTGDWALVLSNGSISTHSPGVTSMANGTGAYLVTFPGAVANCAPQVTSLANGVAAMVDAYHASLTQIGISTFNVAGASANHPFYLSLVCSSKTEVPAG